MPTYSLTADTGAFTFTGTPTDFIPRRFSLRTGVFTVNTDIPIDFGGTHILYPIPSHFTLTGSRAALATPADGIERTVDVSLRFPTPVTTATIKFLPDLSAGDGLVVLEKYYALTLTSDSPTNVLSGSIALPTLSTRSIPYRVQFPKETGFNEHYIYLNAGEDAIELATLLNLSEAINGTIDLADLNDVTITDVAAGQYLRYDGTEWTNSSDYTAERVIITVRNAETTTMPTGTIVYISGATGDNVLVRRAQADTEEASSKTLGMVIQPITSNGTGLVAVNGTVENVNTAAFPAGTSLWLSPTNPGEFTSVVPVAPDHGVFIGWVARSNANAGRIVLHIQNGYEIEELHDVLLTDLASGQVLVYDEDAELWKNETPLGGTGEADKLAVWSDADTLASTESLHWDSSNARLGINTSTPNASVDIAQGSATTGLAVTRQTGDSIHPRVSIRKSRGTPSSPAVVQQGDGIGSLLFAPYNGTAFATSSSITSYVDSTYDPEDPVLPSSLDLRTGGSSARMTIRSSGKIAIGQLTPSVVDALSSQVTIGNTVFNEQLRFRYDSTNYSSVAVSSTGITTFTATGSAPRFVFSNAKVQAIVIPGVTTAVPTINDEVQPNPDVNGLFSVNIQESLEFLTPAGTPVDGQKLLIRIVGNEFAHNLTFNSSYKEGSVELPTVSLIDKTQYLGFFYSASSSKWELVGYTEV
jgi:hypothetical protein